MSDARDDEPTNPLTRCGNLLGELTKVLSEAHDNVEEKVTELEEDLKKREETIKDLETQLKDADPVSAIKAAVHKSEEALRLSYEQQLKDLRKRSVDDTETLDKKVQGLEQEVKKQGKVLKEAEQQIDVHLNYLRACFPLVFPHFSLFFDTFALWSQAISQAIQTWKSRTTSRATPT